MKVYLPCVTVVVEWVINRSLAAIIYIEKEPVTTSPINQTTQQPKPQYGEWMLVTKKRQGVKNGRGHATRFSNPQTEVEPSGTKSDLGKPKTFLFKASTPPKVVSREESLSYTPKGQMVALGSGVGDRSIQLVEPVDKGMKSSHLTRDKKKYQCKREKNS